MKKTRKLWSLLLAMIMVLAMGMSAMAAGTGSITITPPAGTAATARNTYNIYKVFDAVGDGTNISYKLVSGKTTAPAGFTVDAAGNVKLTRTTGDLTQLTADEIAAIAAYVTEDDVVATPTAEGTANAVVEGLPNGYYYITTSTGTVVTIDSTNPDATVKDKNTAPAVDKIITGANSISDEGKKALAQIGTDVTYTASITVGKGMKNYVFHDKMSDGLTLKSNSVTVTTNANPAPTGDWYTIKQTPDEGDTLTITFKDGLPENSVITITYSATINASALYQDPETNDAYVSYGDANSNNKTPHDGTIVHNAYIEAFKFDGASNTPLAGAGFKLKNSEGKFYHLDKTNSEKPVVQWVDEENADEHFSDDKGDVEPFIGLADGEYTLVETTVPAGYNKATDTSYKILSGEYDRGNLQRGLRINNNKGAELPSTGGIGTTMFYVAGGALVLAAVVLLVTRKRMSVEK